MGDSHAILALIFDFDDTLVPDSTTQLLLQHGIDPQQFWGRDAKNLVQSGYDPALAYLKLLLDNIGPGKPLGDLTNEGLGKFGAQLDRKYFPGIPRLSRVPLKYSERLHGCLTLPSSSGLVAAPCARPRWSP